MTGLPTIMHVEDDDDIREIALIALETVGGLVVEQFSSGQEAVANAARIKPDLFLLDVMMPGMSGEETLAALRALPEFTETPIIFMTAKAQHSEVEKLMLLGALDVITKPFDPITLSDQIVAIWKNRQAG